LYPYPVGLEMGETAMPMAGWEPYNFVSWLGALINGSIP